MDFTNAYNNLTQLTTKQFRYDYQFNSHQVSILANLDDKNFQLFVIIYADGLQVCRQLNLYLKNEKYQFNAYWKTEYFSSIFSVIAVNNSLNTFWNDLISRLTKLTNSETVKITPIHYKNLISEVALNSNDNHYLSHLRKSGMTQKQFDKISLYYGKSVANKVRSMGCTLVFSKDPLKSHTIVIDDLIIK
ncbi:hypothetical protein BAUMH2_03655 [Streptococcus agalactiae]|uniref:hypothetical protein n=1 Tax=Streptococcus agalactiae TaxID=1311 RepID=UPI0021D5AE99|nr:hypothetical protein [Streptococcus agalactiae]MCU7657269.1 hypothetical protein [Streptococcus agalactiae]MCU7679522.1 hypothetical protein [Streptococcus agalactiae]MCU7682185.1 hypothetical protein [Streptococcus agalactiae]